jgi:hypothetical protein
MGLSLLLALLTVSHAGPASRLIIGDCENFFNWLEVRDFLAQHPALQQKARDARAKLQAANQRLIQLLTKRKMLW